MGTEKALTWVVFVVFTLTILIFLVQSVSFLVGAFVIDDGMYYLEVPKNIVLGNGVTYDNRTATNGFHPLWGGIGVLAALITQARTEPYFRLMMVFQAVFLLLGLFFLWQTIKDMHLEISGAVVATMIIFYSRLDLWLSTMESATLLVSLALLVFLSYRKDLLRSGNLRRSILLGVLLALVFLSRLDSIFIVIAFLATKLLLNIKSGFRFRNLLPTMVSGCAFTILTAPYLVINKWYFGSIVPVSGIRKINDSSAFTQSISTMSAKILAAVADKLQIPVFLMTVFVIIGSLFLIVLFFVPKVRSRLSNVFKNGVIAALVIGILMRSLYLLAYVPEYSFVPWYWVPEYVLASLFAGIVAGVLTGFLPWSGPGKRILTYGIVLVLGIPGGLYLYSDAVRYQESNQIIYRAALWASENVPDNRLFAMTDSGVFAYFSNRDVIPMNGLITDMETMEKIREGRYFDVLNQYEVDYLVDLVDEKQALPTHIVLYQSDVIPNNTYGGNRLVIMKYKEYPDETMLYAFR
jgi:hypothetical protein